MTTERLDNLGDNVPLNSRGTVSPASEAPRPVITSFTQAAHQLNLFARHNFKLSTSVFQSCDSIDVGNRGIFVFSRAVY